MVASTNIGLVPFDPATDADPLVEFLSGNEFPYHVARRLTADAAREMVDAGRFWSASTTGFWIDANGERVGIVVLEDLDDVAAGGSPLFDLRLAEPYRGRGLGLPAVGAITDLVFKSFTEVTRFEGQTREDNIAMRTTFERAGFVKEAHYRESWPVVDGPPKASIAYAILRRDWESGTTTPLEWDDLPGEHEGSGRSSFRDTDGVATDTERVEFFFDPMCPYAYQTSLWIRDVRRRRPLDIVWRFFSLEEINRPEGKRHPWDRPLAYGWTPMRVAAWLRRVDMELCDRWYAAAGHALHVEGRRSYDPEIAKSLLAEIDAPPNTWDAALADPTTHDDVLADHRHAVDEHAGFGVPIIVLPAGRPIFGPVVVPAPTGDDADRLWELCTNYATFSGLFELKTPKSPADLELISDAFANFFAAREWPSVQNPAP